MRFVAEDDEVRCSVKDLIREHLVEVKHWQMLTCDLFGRIRLLLFELLLPVFALGLWVSS